MFEANINPSPEDEDLERLALRGLREGLDPQEATRLDALAASDPARAQRVAELAQTWAMAGLIEPGSQHSHLMRDGLSRRHLIAAGAGGAIAASVAAWWFVGTSSRLYQAPDSGPLRARLADGTEVVLSRGGRLHVRMDGARRSARMESGAALWTVAKDRARPFEVAVADHRLVVLGTRFNVDPDPSGLRVDLLEGSLRVEPGRDQDPVVLKPGEYYWAGHQPLVAPGDGAASAAWVDGRLVFEDVTLAQVAVKIRLHTGQQLHFTDPKVAALRFSGVLSVNDPENWKPGLEAVLPIQVAPTANGFTIEPRGGSRPRV
ncbi:MAG: FecR domain-containing protein [Caulobacteraceae bacterium]|nr:FecR domain-containing protein [Caulobacteraceae bacterium]